MGVFPPFQHMKHESACNFVAAIFATFPATRFRCAKSKVRQLLAPLTLGCHKIVAQIGGVTNVGFKGCVDALPENQPFPAFSSFFCLFAPFRRFRTAHEESRQYTPKSWKSRGQAVVAKASPHTQTDSNKHLRGSWRGNSNHGHKCYRLPWATTCLGARKEWGWSPI